MDKGALFILMLTSGMLGLSVYGMKFYTCRWRLDLVMVALYATMTLAYMILLVMRSCLCSGCLENYLYLTLFVLVIALAVEMVAGFVLTIINQYTEPRCYKSAILMVSNWVVTGIGSLSLLVVIVSTLCYYIIAIRKKIRRRKLKQELATLFEVIYDPKVNVDRLIEKYKDLLESEPVSENEMAVLLDCFVTPFDYDQTGLKEEDQQSCTICIQEFKPQEGVLYYPLCEHSYHWVCIQPWFLQQKMICPMCKQPLRMCMIKAIRSNKRAKAAMQKRG